MPVRLQSYQCLVSFNSNTDVHTVASLLKLYLRELPEPVIPFQKYEEFLACAKLLSKDDEMVGNRKPHILPITDFISLPKHSLTSVEQSH